MHEVNPTLIERADVEHKLESIAIATLRYPDANQLYELAELFAKIYRSFQSESSGGRKAPWALGFNQWANDFKRISPRNVYYFKDIGVQLLPHVTKDELRRLGMRKARTLARVARAGKLTRDLLDYALGENTTSDEVESKAGLLPGGDFRWERCLCQVSDHSTAQAALLVLGNRLGYQTYTADREKMSNGKKLGDVATVRDLEPFATEGVMKSARNIDVIWLEDMPEFFFEVENSTDITPGLQRMFQVIGYNSKFFIVSPAEKRARYDREVGKKPFNRYKDKYRFRSYEQLGSMLKADLKYRPIRDEFLS
ncbi:MAG TPA: hypothetical protein VL523_01165 [Terriglobia bacterium]|nr:hypothetical protein [Terriglobia bacterium]